MVLERPSAPQLHVTTQLPLGLTAECRASNCGPRVTRRSGRSRYRTNVEWPCGNAAAGRAGARTCGEAAPWVPNELLGRADPHDLGPGGVLPGGPKAQAATTAG